MTTTLAASPVPAQIEATHEDAAKRPASTIPSSAVGASRLRKPIGLLLAASLLGLLSACGYHLRDALMLPPDMGPVRVIAPDPYSPLAESLAQALERAGAVRAPPGAPADLATLQVWSEQFADTSISVDQFGRSQEFALRYAVVFSARRKGNGAYVVPRQAIELARDYVATPDDSLGRNSERELLVRELRRDMVQSILRRIDAAVRNPAATTPATPVPAPAVAPLPATTP